MLKGPEIRRLTVQQQVYERLKKAILMREIPPGQRLNEVELAQHLGVSPTPVREVLKELKGEGIVEMTNDGMRVLSLTTKDIEDILDIRSHLEGFAVRRAATHLTQSDLEVLEDILGGQTVLAEEADNIQPLFSEDVERMHVINEQFHGFLVNRAGNRWLGQMLTNLNTLLLYVRMELTKATDGKRSHQEHFEILSSLRNKDVEGAVQAMHRHIDRVKTQSVSAQAEREKKTTL